MNEANLFDTYVWAQATDAAIDVMKLNQRLDAIVGRLAAKHIDRRPDEVRRAVMLGYNHELTKAIAIIEGVADMRDIKPADEGVILRGAMGIVAKDAALDRVEAMLDAGYAERTREGEPARRRMAEEVAKQMGHGQEQASAQEIEARLTPSVIRRDYPASGGKKGKK